jgi:hypothetical protein
MSRKTAIFKYTLMGGRAITVVAAAVAGGVVVVARVMAGNGG